MADHDKFDPRVDSLVVETRTAWASDIGADLNVEEKSVISAAVHAQPQLATEVAYDRAHTGFTRTITVHAADIERIYQQSLGG